MMMTMPSVHNMFTAVSNRNILILIGL